jgi:hypothetical protein
MPLKKPGDKQSQIEEWSRLYGRQIPEEEYREICDNLKAYFGLLIKADRAQREIRTGSPNEGR